MLPDCRSEIALKRIERECEALTDPLDITQGKIQYSMNEREMKTACDFSSAEEAKLDNCDDKNEFIILIDRSTAM